MKIFKAVFIFVVLLSLALFVKATDMHQVIRLVDRIGFNFLALIFITFTAYFFATLGWKYCMGKQGEKLPVLDLFLIRHIGEMVSIINPASVIGGEAVKLYLLQNKGIEKTTLTASILIARVMMMVTQLLLLLLTLIFLLLNGTNFGYSIPSNPPAYIGLLLLLLSLVIFLRSNSSLKNRFKNSWAGRYLAKLTDKLQLKQVFKEFGFFFRTDKKRLLLCTFFFSLHWIAGSLEIYFILKFMDIDSSVVKVLFADMGIIVFKAAGAFVPGQIGVEELGNKVMLDVIGLQSPEIWITVSILRRLRQLFWLFFGLAAYLIAFKKLKPGI
jgi:uncharacterized protein (TIRG00374 family)